MAPTGAVFNSKNSFFWFKITEVIFVFKTKLKKNIRFLVILLFPGYFHYAQDVEDKITKEQIWFDYNPSYKVSEKLDFYGDIGANTL